MGGRVEGGQWESAVPNSPVAQQQQLLRQTRSAHLAENRVLHSVSEFGLLVHARLSLLQAFVADHAALLHGRIEVSLQLLRDEGLVGRVTPAALVGHLSKGEEGERRGGEARGKMTSEG